MVVNHLVRGGTVFGILGAAFGTVGLILADGGLATRNSTSVGWPQIELTLGRFNRLGAAVTIVLALIGILGSRLRSPATLAAGAAGFGLMAMQVLVQWGRGANLFGGDGRNLAIWAALGTGFAAIGWGLRRARASDAALPTSPP